MKTHGIEVWSYFVDENIVWNNQVRTCAYTVILVDMLYLIFSFDVKYQFMVVLDICTKF